MTDAQASAATIDRAALDRLVAEADTGGRTPGKQIARVLFAVAVAWSLFQVWYASPLPFVFNVFILNDTEARSIHLAFAVFLAFFFTGAGDLSIDAAIRRRRERAR